MREHSWKQVQEMYDSAVKMVVPMAATLSMEYVYGLTPMLWIDFLNTDPEDSGSMWSVYIEVIRAVQDLKDWMVRRGYQYDEELGSMGLLSMSEFLERYPKEFMADATILRNNIRTVIEENRFDLIATGGVLKSSEAMMTITSGLSIGLSIPSIFYTVHVTNDSPGSPYSMRLCTPQANCPNFWFSVILGGMFLSIAQGVSVNQCIAPDCEQYFVPSLRGRGQAYHSQRCQNRHYMRKRRSQS